MIRCRHCAGVIQRKDKRWYHVVTARYSCRDLMGYECKAEPA